MTFQERADKTEDELKNLCWENVEALDRLKSGRIFFMGQCFEKERIGEYFYKARKKAVKVSSRMSGKEEE